MTDLLVIGAGLSGLTAAWQAAAAGQRVKVIAKGWGTTHWHAGCIDVLGYYPLDSDAAVDNPAESVARLIAGQPQHPYAIVGVERLTEAMNAFQKMCEAAGYPLRGTLERNWLLPTAVGAARPTCFAPESFLAGNLQWSDPMLIVGFKQLPDFYANLVADNLAAHNITTHHVTLDLPRLAGRRFVASTILARLFDTADFRAEVIKALKPELARRQNRADLRLGLPAVLGLEQPTTARGELESELDCKVFEIPTMPPSIPGMRLHRLLLQAIEAAGGRVYDGMEAVGAAVEEGRVTAVYTEAAARQRSHKAGSYLLATGGILGGGIQTNHAGQVREVVFDLPVVAPDNRAAWFKQAFLDREGHPIYQAGLTVDAQFRPVNGDGRAVYQNLYAAGATLAHCELIRERSWDGVAIATGYAAAQTGGMS